MCRAIMGIAMLMAVVMASITMPFKVQSTKNEWTEKVSRSCSAGICDANSDGDGLSIGAIKGERDTTYGLWRLQLNFKKYRGKFGRWQMKLIYSDSSSVILDAGKYGQAGQAVEYQEYERSAFWYVGIYALPNDILKGAVKLVVYVEELEGYLFGKTPYWVFNKKDLKELRKVALHQF